MNHLLHIQSSAPSKISQEEKYSMPVSLARGLRGENIVISRYRDDVWDFYPYIPQENLSNCHKRIRWNLALPDGRLLTDAFHSHLLDSAKDFIWSLYAVPIDGHARPKMITLIAKFELLQPLLRWMVSGNIPSFSDIGDTIMQFIPFARLRSSGKDVVAQSTLASRLNMVEYLYYQREKLLDAILTHPWPHETALSISGSKRGGDHRKPTTEFVPEKVTSELARVAIDYVQNRSKRILAARSSFVDDTSDHELLTQNQVNARTVIARNYGFEGSRDLRSQSLHLRTACFIVIDMFSGIRDSEMMSLNESCISMTRSADDTMDVFLLRGTIYKTGVRPKKWIVPPVVKEAVEALKKLTEPFRQRLLSEETILYNQLMVEVSKFSDQYLQTASKRLHTVANIKDKIFLSEATKHGNEISTVSMSVINNNLKKFCAEHEIHGTDNKPYLLHSHQFRRTYARFVARAELGDLLMLKEHFGHWTLDMTLYYADGALDDFEIDTELLELVSSEKISRQTEIFSDQLKSDAPLANGGGWLKEWRGAVRSAKNKEALIAEYAGTVTLNGTGHSWCVGNSRGNGCGGLCILEATMCVDCKYGIIGKEHRPVWNGIRNQQLEALALDDMGPSGRARASDILWKAEKVLRRLDGETDD